MFVLSELFIICLLAGLGLAAIEVEPKVVEIQFVYLILINLCVWKS